VVEAIGDDLLQIDERSPGSVDVGVGGLRSVLRLVRFHPLDPLRDPRQVELELRQPVVEGLETFLERDDRGRDGYGEALLLDRDGLVGTAVLGSAAGFSSCGSGSSPRNSA
jgi:hypothetical protein